MYPFIRSILFQLDAERAHHLTLRWLSMFPSTAGWLNSSPQPAAMLKQRLFGLDFPHPVGLAAGLDKDGIAVDGLLAAGFSFVEVGTVTPRPQPGNPKPRLFRLRADEALINRMGFNNHGVTALQQNLLKRRRQGIVGVNLGKNKMTPNEQALTDYLEGMDVIFPLADYIVINVSSPNTPGLRDLQAASQLVPLIEAVCKRRDELAAGNANMPDQSGLAYKSALGPGNAPDHRPAVLVKLAPDLSDDALVALASDLPATGMDGFIATNTTLSREGPRISGRPHGRDGWSQRSAFICAIDRCGFVALPHNRRQTPNYRFRRHLLRRRCVPQDSCRRQPHRAVHGLHLSWPSPDC